MFSTQDAKQLNLGEDWILIGAYCEYTEGKTTGGGYGCGGYQGVLEVATEQLTKKYGLNVIVVNTTFKTANSSSHPSYGRDALIIAGDIYKKRA